MAAAIPSRRHPSPDDCDIHLGAEADRFASTRSWCCMCRCAISTSCATTVSPGNGTSRFIAPSGRVPSSGRCRPDANSGREGGRREIG